MNFEFTTSSRIIFGPGTIRQCGELAASQGKQVFIVTNLPEDRANKIIDIVKSQKVDVSLFQISGEPNVNRLSEGLAIARENHCDLVIGLGGGSAIDYGKAIAGLITNAGDVYHYLEVVGDGNPISTPPVPMIAIPTTAGTGAEVTRNAVLSVPEKHVKVSMRSHLLLPKIALIDPELTYDLPQKITASTGLDALTQLIEPYVSWKSNPLTDVICKDGIFHAAHSLLKAYSQNDPGAREEMSLASLYGGMALANAGLGIVHGFAGVLGGMYPVPHGVICARLLPAAMEVNLRTIQMRNPDSIVLSRYDTIAQLLTSFPNAKAVNGINWVKELSSQLNIPSLKLYGLSLADIPEIIEKTEKASSTKANPIHLTRDELVEILNSGF